MTNELNDFPAQETIPAQDVLGFDPSLSGTTSTSQHYASVSERPQAIADSLGNTEIAIPVAAVSVLAIGACGLAARTKLQRYKKKRVELKAQREADEQQTVRTLSFKGSVLALSHLIADAYIGTQAPDEDEPTIKIIGKRKMVDAVKSYDNEYGVYVTAQNTTYVAASLFGTPRPWLQRLIEKTGVRLVSPEDTMRITAFVPRGIDLNIDQVHGQVTALGNYGHARIHSDDGTEVMVEDVTSASLHSGTLSQIKVENINGFFLKANAGFGSSITVEDGLVPSLITSLDTISRFIFGGTVTESAHITAGFASKAGIKRANGQIKIVCDTDASAVIKGGRSSILSIEAGYKGVAAYDGSAQEATVILPSNARARIGSVLSFLKLQAGHNSDCQITSGDIPEVDISVDSSSSATFGGAIIAGDIQASFNSSVHAARYMPGVKICKDSGSRVTSGN